MITIYLTGVSPKDSTIFMRYGGFNGRVEADGEEIVYPGDPRYEILKLLGPGKHVLKGEGDLLPKPKGA